MSSNLSVKYPEHEPLTPEENFAHLAACIRPEDKETFLERLSPKERMQLHAVGSDLEQGLISYPATFAQEKTLRLDSPVQKHVNLLYRALFEMVQTAQKKAQAENKPLQLVVGDIHMDRTALLVMSMLLHISHRLNIQSVGAEVPEDAEVTYQNGGIKYGLKQQLANIRSMNEDEEINEFGGICFTGQNRNFDFLIKQAVDLGIESGLFANDPKAIITQSDIDQISNPETWRKRLSLDRDQPMNQLLNDMATQRKDCISFYGIGHLLGMSEYDSSNAARMYISAANCYINCSESKPNPLFRDFTTLPLDISSAKEIGEGEREGNSPLVQVFVDGWLYTAKEALSMAKEADKLVGQKLAPLPEEKAQNIRKR